jgi:serine protease Do
MTAVLLVLGLAIPLQDPAEDPQVQADEILRTVRESVVALRVDREPEKTSRAAGPFGRRPRGATASGVIIDPAGYILTSRFNVAGKVKKIEVILADGTVKEARLLGYDAPLDVALLKIAATDLPVPRFAKTGKLQLGDPVFVIGRAPGGKGWTFNPGILSAQDRFAGKMVQTDAKINFGNVGGILVDRKGLMIGMTCKIDTRYAGTYGQNSGVGFAARWEKIADAMPKLKQGARLESEKRPFLGVIYDPDSTEKGVRLLEVQPDTAAAKAGLRAGDIILTFAGETLKSPSDLLKIINQHKVGDKLDCTVKRDGKILELKVTLGERKIRDE